ncbi:MAG: Rieske 2Fe-2S domain-containing protein [Acidobacteria bacterium]|jgi:nitrite reductase (NADH) small subunit/3-phenylpropionate/trans-cinnamate dioxygenase ferredoxin subunit|nr:Rieske 2Fe-2S domain-containing protein [Acidobacteriota bacterium]
MGKTYQNKLKPERTGKKVTVGRVEAVPPGRGATVKLKNGAEVALFNVNGKFHAIENFCPHKAYPLADSRLYGNIVECDLHGWRFDVRSGECFTKKSCSIESYEVLIEDEMIKILV